MALWSLMLILGSAVMSMVNGNYMDETRLKGDLLVGYDRDSLPAESTTVKFRLNVKHYTMVEESQTLMVNAWMVNDWVDPRLSWNPQDYNGLKRITVPHSYLWKPDLDIYNSANLGETVSYGSTLVIIFHNGRVLFVPPVKLHFTCIMDLTYWPHDTHNCTCIFGSWVHTGSAIDVQLMDDKPKMDISWRTTDDGRNLTRGTWDLINSSIVRDIKSYNCCVDPFITIHMSMTLQRNAPAYSWIIKGPAIGMSILTLVVFLLPPAAGEKITFGILCVILDMIFIAYSSHIINYAPSHTPLIVKLICKQIFLVVISIVLGSLSLRMARDPHTNGIPFCFKKFLICTSSILCLNNYKNLVSRTHHQPYSRPLKSDEFELRSENGNGHLYTGEVHTSPGLDWLLLAAVMDRVCLITLIGLFIANIFNYLPIL